MEIFIHIVKYIFYSYSDIEIVATKRYLEKKLSVIARSIFFICKALPCFCLLRDNQNVFYYKVYKSAKSNGIFDEDFDVKRITITNEKIKCGVSVEYISSKDLLGQFQVEKNKNDVYVGNDENDFDFCVYKKRPRFFSESIKKKINPSYEILNFSTEDPIKLNDNYFTVNNNMTHSPSGKRKLSVQYDSKDNLIHLLSNEEIEGLGPFEKEEEKDSEINLKLEDSSVPSLTESSHCEFQLNIEDEAGNTKILNEEDNLNLSQFKNLVSILTKLKQSYKKNRTKKKINVNRLYKLMCNK